MLHHILMVKDEQVLKEDTKEVTFNINGYNKEFNCLNFVY